MLWGAFFDDVYCAEPSPLAQSGFWAFKRLCQITGFPTSDHKGHPPTTDLLLLGALIALGDSPIRAQIRPDRVDKPKSHIAQAFRTNYLTPAAASKLRGEIGFYTSLLPGELGRGMMGPLIRRQYCGVSHRLNRKLTRNLARRYSDIGNLPRRVTPYSTHQPVGAHTDAQGFGHIASVR